MRGISEKSNFTRAERASVSVLILIKVIFYLIVTMYTYSFMIRLQNRYGYVWNVDNLRSGLRHYLFLP